MRERIDIHDPLYDICERLGLEPTFVKELTVTPRTVTATVYAGDENGQKYVAGPNEAVVLRTHEFEVQT